MMVTASYGLSNPWIFHLPILRVVRIVDLRCTRRPIKLKLEHVYCTVHRIWSAETETTDAEAEPKYRHRVVPRSTFCFFCFHVGCSFKVCRNLLDLPGYQVDGQFNHSSSCIAWIIFRSFFNLMLMNACMFLFLRIYSIWNSSFLQVCMKIWHISQHYMHYPLFV